MVPKKKKTEELGFQYFIVQKHVTPCDGRRQVMRDIGTENSWRVEMEIFQIEISYN